MPILVCYELKSSNCNASELNRFTLSRLLEFSKQQDGELEYNGTISTAWLRMMVPVSLREPVDQQAARQLLGWLIAVVHNLIVTGTVSDSPANHAKAQPRMDDWN